jgi:hypothetical protein
MITSKVVKNRFLTTEQCENEMDMVKEKIWKYERRIRELRYYKGLLNHRYSRLKHEAEKK